MVLVIPYQTDCTACTERKLCMFFFLNSETLDKDIFSTKKPPKTFLMFYDLNVHLYNPQDKIYPQSN